MGDISEKKMDECVMKCSECSHKMNVCRSRIISKKNPTCPECGAFLVPLREVPAKKRNGPNS